MANSVIAQLLFLEKENPDADVDTMQYINLLATRRAVAELYAQRTVKPVEAILADLERDYHMTAQEAKDYGIVDQVLETNGRKSA